MMKFHGRLVEEALLVTTIVAGALLFCTVAWAADEPSTCKTKTCVVIDYYYNCSTGLGESMQISSCLPCCTDMGRCQNGSAGLLVYKIE